MPIKTLFLIGLSLAVCNSDACVAQVKSDALESRILALERDWNAAYKRGDISAMDSLLADDFVITTEDGSTFSKTGFIARSGGSMVHVETSDMSDLRVRTQGNTAVVIGAYHETGLERGKPYEYKDRFTDVWVNINGRWRVLASHYSLRATQ